MRTQPIDDEAAFLARLRAGDEAAFLELVDRHGPLMLRVARSYVRDDGAAEEVVQEAWLGMLRGLDGFQHRSSLRTWLLAIVANRAKTRARRDARTLPFSTLAAAELADDERAVDPDRFIAADAPHWPGHWLHGPARWSDDPARRLETREMLAALARSLDTLPPAQRAVVSLRDLGGFEMTTICSMMEISETNARVLLHRGRSKLRRALEGMMA